MVLLYCTSNTVIKVSIKHEILNLFFECIFLCPANSSCRKLFVVLVDVLLNHFGLTLLWRGFQKIKRIIKMSGRILWICNTIKCTYLLNRFQRRVVRRATIIIFSIYYCNIILTFDTKFIHKRWSSKEEWDWKIHTWKQFKPHQSQGW